MPKKSSGPEDDGSSPPPRLPAKVSQKRRPRVPPAVDGIQSNTCRNAGCPNFGIEPLAAVTRGGAKKGARVRDDYMIVGHNKLKGQSRLRCVRCGEHASLKSNLGIKEELDRIRDSDLACGALLPPIPDRP